MIKFYNLTWPRSQMLAFWLVCLCVPLFPAQAQQAYTVKGRIVEVGSNIPAIGGTVQIEGTNFGGFADADGYYSFEADVVPGIYTLVFRAIGYEKAEKTYNFGNRPEINVDFEVNTDILSLDEVVVTGPSVTSSRKQLGTAISTIAADEIQNVGSQNPLAAISGRVPGAQVYQNQGDPGGGFSVRLRGVSTINGSSEPLYIVDGVIVDNSSTNVINLNADAMETEFQAGQNRLVDINPNDIERIEVLNGASATAIYGSLASNGVVQIFTKRGQKGKPRVNFSTSIMISELRKRLDFNMFPERFGFPGDERLSTRGDRLTMIADLRSTADKLANPGTGPAALGGPLVENTYPVQRYDYQDNIFQTAIGTDNYLSLTGGNDDTDYFASVGYSRNEGIIRNTNFQKYGLRFRLNHRFSDYVNLSAGANYTNSSSKDMPNGNNFFSPISTMIIIDNVWDITERDEQGNLRHVEQQRVNPLSVIETFDITQETNRFIGDMQLSLFPVEGLSLDYKLGIDTYSLVGNTLQPRLPYEPVAATFFPDGYASVATSNVFRINQDWVAAYQTDITDELTSTTTVGAQLIYENTKFSRSEGRDLAPFIKTIDGAQNFFNNPTETQTEQSIWGYFLQQSFGYRDLLFLTLAGRIDGSSAFGKDQRNQFYPKASASFVLSELGFWDGTFGNAWNTMKLRASYGEAGNLTVIDPFDRFIVSDPVVLPIGGGFSPSDQLGQPDIKPERMKEFEIGADMSFLNSRLALSFTYYEQEIEDLVLNVNVSPSAGGRSIIRNAGKMENKGVELMLTGTPVLSNNFGWDVSLIYSTYDNELSGIGGGRAGFQVRGGGGTQSAIDGQPLGTFFANFYARNDDGTLLLNPDGLPQVERGDDETGTPQKDGNGQPTGDPLRKVLGDPNPDYTLSFINDFRYKKLGLRVQFDAVQGFEVYNWNKITSNNVGASPLSEQELRGELPRGWVAAVGGFIGPRIQEEHVEDGSFIKLREIALTYDLGKVGLFNNIGVALVGRNLFSIDDYTGYDPETNSAGQSSNVRGDDFGNVPIPRTYQMKVSASF